MSNVITLVARNEAFIALVSNEEHTFLDGNFNLVGNQKSPVKGFGQAMVEIIQSTAFDLTTQLLKPDGTKFDLTGVSALQVNIYQKSPVRLLISATAGAPTGALIDGLALFSISAASTNFIGYAQGIVTLVKNAKPMAFELFQLKYTENPTVPLP